MTAATRLSAATVGDLAAEIGVPTFDRTALRPSIVHVGVGGFHRAHLAVYINELCALGHQNWSIVGAGVLPADQLMADVLDSQDHLYTLITRGHAATTVEVIGSIIGYIHAADHARDLIARIADPATQIVSLTVTEGGYPIDDLTGEYLADSRAAGDGSAFAIIGAGLERRREAGAGPITVMSCDNIVANGAATRTATLGEAARRGGAIEQWVADNIAFPNAMVDRITPATTDADRRYLAETWGLDDRWPVVTEPFRQWVIEDEFAGERLPFDELDVIVTSDVEPYEHMKLRLLNAAHSCLAYLAALEGIETVDTALADPHIRRFIDAFLEHEAQPVLSPVRGIDFDDYRASLIERFSNPEIGDQISRLCLDGSAKFPKFLLPTVRAELEAGGPVALSALALAGWCEYLFRGASGNLGSELSADPLLAIAVDHARRSATDPASFLEFADVFGDLASDERFRRAFVDALELIRSSGVPSAVDATLEGAGVRHDRPGG